MKIALKLFLSIAGLFGASAAHALPTVSLSSSSADIEVGEVIEVVVSIEGANSLSDGSLDAWGFIVSPLASSVFDYVGATVSSPYWDVSNPLSDGDVAGLLSDPLFDTGTSFELATLSLLARNPGLESLNLSGPLDGFHGLVFQNTEFAFDESIDITVNDTPLSQVPDNGSSVFLAAFAVLGVVGMKRFGVKRNF